MPTRRSLSLRSLASERVTSRRSTVAFPPATWACRVTKAQHITLVLEGADPHFEIQLLEFDPPSGTDPGAHPTNLRQRGFNHLAFRVDDIEAATAHLVANGVTVLSDEMDYISRKLRLFEGPEGLTLELVEWVA